MKRSVSPLSGSPETQSKKRRLISVFSALKDVFFRLSSKSNELAEKIEAKLENSASGNDELPNSFVSQKRKKLIHDNAKRLSLSIPRSSVSAPAGKGMLESLYELAHFQKQNNDILGEFTRLGLNGEEHLARKSSPSMHVPKTRALPKASKQEPSQDFSETSYTNNLQPLIVEQDYTPIYEDESGNLIRPSFIHLDPRERYHLLQMKKSMEASDFLQSRLKYMVDPDETTSMHQSNNKVDTSTQTHTKDFLDKSLNFNSLRTKLALQNRKQRKSKKSSGFSGEFFYDPSEADIALDANLKFKGALASINKPQFTSKPESKGEELFADADPHHVSLKRRGSISQRLGLETTLRVGKTKESLDDDFKQKGHVFNGIKVQDVPAVHKPDSVGPSSAFKFDIKEDKINSILGLNKAEDKQPQLKVAETSGGSLFGTPAVKSDDDTKSILAQSSVIGSKKLFSFGQKPEPKNATNDDAHQSTKKLETPASSNSFGFTAPEKLNGESESQIAPTKPFTIGKNLHETAKPAFSFGDTDTKDGSKKSTFSFGSGTQKDVKKPPTFSFGHKDNKTDASSSMFSIKNSDSDTKSKTPAFSFGASGNKGSETQNAISGVKFESSTSNKPAFSFDSKDTKNSPNGAKPTTEGAFSFGGNGDPTHQRTSKFEGFGKPANETEQTKQPPKFNFGAPSKSLGTFSSGNEAQEPRSKKRAPDSDGDSVPAALKTNNLSFSTLANQSSTKDDSSREKLFLFGAKPETSAASIFAKNESSNNVDSKLESRQSEKTTFTFGKPVAANSDAPTFSFGKASSSTSTKETPSFSFTKPDKAESQNSPSSAAESKESTKPTFPGIKQGMFESGSKPVVFGNQTSSSEPTPAPSFPFANSNPTQPSASTSSFNFGQSATADPALIFGASNNAPAPAFNFSAQTPAKPLGPGPLPAPFASATATGTGFSFSNTAMSSFGGSRPATPSNPGFGFGTEGQNAGQASTNFGGFNNATAPSSVFGGTSRSVTPSFGGFGQPQSGQPQNGQINSAQTQAQSTGFSFSSNITGGPAFNSAPGSFGQASRESTPPAFGAPVGGVPQPAVNFNGRRLAHMRPRRR